MPLLTEQELLDFASQTKDICNIDKLDVFIESGTYLGETISTASKVFKTCYTIEIHEPTFNYRIKPNLVPKFSNVSFILGESYRVFETLLPTIQEPCLFWLDGHYSGPGTGQGTVDAPINEELEVIIRTYKYPCCIAIDDVRLFGKKLGEDWRNVTEESILNQVQTSNRLIKWHYIGDRMLLFLSSN